jgi:hypothetical protein
LRAARMLAAISSTRLRPSSILGHQTVIMLVPNANRCVRSIGQYSIVFAFCSPSENSCFGLRGCWSDGVGDTNAGVVQKGSGRLRTRRVASKVALWMDSKGIGHSGETWNPHPGWVTGEHKELGLRSGSVQTECPTTRRIQISLGFIPFSQPPRTEDRTPD